MTLSKNILEIVSKFSQALASNEVKIRNQGFKKVSSYLMRKTLQPDGITKEEMLNIWKGLFYCMWMSDKPDVQEKLASRMADVMLELKSDEGKQILFEEFLTTMQREWTGIDRLRMDKYYLLFRFMFQRCFQYLKSTNWDEKRVTWFLTLLKEGPLHPYNINTRNCPLGIRYHITDIYLDELESCCDDDLAGKKLTAMFEPFCLILQQTIIEDLCTRIVDKIFQVIIDKSPPALKIVYETTGMQVDGLKFNFNYSSIAGMLGIQNKNRKLSMLEKDNSMLSKTFALAIQWYIKIKEYDDEEKEKQEEEVIRLYANVKKFRELAIGDVALDEFPDLTAFDGLTENSVNEENLVEALTKQYEEDHLESQQEKRQMKKTRKSTAKLIEHETFSVGVAMSDLDGDVPVATMPDDDDDVTEMESTVEHRTDIECSETTVPEDQPGTAEDASEDQPETQQMSTADDESTDTTSQSTGAKSSATKKSFNMTSRGLSKSGKRRFRRKMSKLKLQNNTAAGVAVLMETSSKEQPETMEEDKSQEEVAEKQPETSVPQEIAIEAQKSPSKPQESPKSVSPKSDKAVANDKSAVDGKKVEGKKAKKRKNQISSELEAGESATAVKVALEPEKVPMESAKSVVETRKKKNKSPSSMCPAEVTKSITDSSAMSESSSLNTSDSGEEKTALFQAPDWIIPEEEKMPAFMKSSMKSIKLKTKKKKQKNVPFADRTTPAPNQSKSGKKVRFADKIGVRIFGPTGQSVTYTKEFHLVETCSTKRGGKKKKNVTKPKRR